MKLSRLAIFSFILVLTSCEIEGINESTTTNEFDKSNFLLKSELENNTIINDTIETPNETESEGEYGDDVEDRDENS
ncbi:hypothetical protein [Aquimarina agarivorans]|uniref:hypothetical protein n=1 Tax=Aquimarina agarivorans TaxID=980584 RepID=UPI000248E7C6|nr:hypothetical protein [Aquimarina agarivorans]